MLTLGNLISRRRAPSILATTSVLSAAASDPYTVAHTVTTGTNCVVAIGGWTQTASKVISSITYGGDAMTLISAEDNDPTADAVGCYIAYKLNPATGAQNFIADLTSGAPEYWSWVIFDLAGVNTGSPIVASSTSIIEAAGGISKYVIADTTGSPNETLVLGGRTKGNGNARPFTPGTNVTEVADDTYGNLSLFVGKREDMPSTVFAFACTSFYSQPGDAMAVVAFSG